MSLNFSSSAPYRWLMVLLCFSLEPHVKASYPLGILSEVSRIVLQIGTNTHTHFEILFFGYEKTKGVLYKGPDLHPNLFYILPKL